MKTKKLIIRVVLWVCFFCGATYFLAPGWSNATMDHALYAELLEKYVQNGTIAYQGFKNEEAKFDQYLKILEETDTKKLSRNEQFAFYVNAYNAWTIKLILTGYPGIKSIKDLGSIFKSPWEKQIVRINGDIITLDHIEHDILRPRFKDPRVHFVVNCASQGIVHPKGVLRCDRNPIERTSWSSNWMQWRGHLSMISGETVLKGERFM